MISFERMKVGKGWKAVIEDEKEFPEKCPVCQKLPLLPVNNFWFCDSQNLFMCKNCIKKIHDCGDFEHHDYLIMAIEHCAPDPTDPVD